MPAPSVIVVGSLNIDYIASVERLPRAGETIAARELIRRFGGKGANQAVAAARQGACVAMLGCVGADDDGKAYCAQLRTEGIDTQGIVVKPGALTGTALIAVDRAAENLIIVGAGANGLLSPGNIRKARDRIASAGMLLLQFETPMASIVEAVRVANRAGVPVVLNPSPLCDGFPWGKCELHTLIANEGEAEAIFARELASLPKELARWQLGLRRRHIGHLLITRGARPTLYLSQKRFQQIPTMRVRPVDTVGAGDAFAGTFAARLANGTDLMAAVLCANCAGALATLKAGAQDSIPSREAVDKSMRRVAQIGH